MRGREYCSGELGSILLNGYAPGSARAEGSSIDDMAGLNPFTRESKARTGRFLREKLISDHHSIFSSYEGLQGAANGQYSWGFFRDAQGFGRLYAGSRAGFTSSRFPPPWTSVFQFSLFLY